MSVHLLSCQCGRDHKVEPRQAGSELICECGQTTTAPSMREIRALPQSAEVGASEKYRESWSLKNGAFFAIGGLMIVAGLALAGGFGFLRSRVDTTEPKIDEVRVQASNEQIDKMPPVDLVQTFFAFEETGIDYYGKSPYLANVRLAANYMIVICVGFGLMLVGIGAIAYSVVAK